MECGGQPGLMMGGSNLDGRWSADMSKHGSRYTKLRKSSSRLFLLAKCVKKDCIIDCMARMRMPRCQDAKPMALLDLSCLLSCHKNALYVLIFVPTSDTICSRIPV